MLFNNPVIITGWLAERSDYRQRGNDRLVHVQGW